MEYQDEKVIFPCRIQLMLATALHYNFHTPSVYRYLQGNYTGAWQDIPSLLAYLQGKVLDDCITHIERVFTVESPAKLVVHSFQKKCYSTSNTEIIPPLQVMKRLFLA